MAGGVRINRQAIRQLTREIEKELARNPVKVPLEADSSSISFPSSATVTNNYHGPVVTVHGDNAQLAWSNQDVSQTQNHDIAPGFEPLAKVLTGLLASVAALGLSEEDSREVQDSAEVVLREIVNAEPERGVIKRGLTMVKGLLAPVATGASAAVSAESAELAKTVIEGLGSTLPF